MFFDLKQLHFFQYSAWKMLSVMQAGTQAGGIKVAASVDSELILPLNLPKIQGPAVYFC